MFKNRGLDPNTAFLQTAPVHYVNRRYILAQSGGYICGWGGKALVIGGKRALDAALEQLAGSLDRTGVQYDVRVFSGECSDENIHLIEKNAKAVNAEIVIGIGGGKALDAAKAAAGLCNLPVVCIPTIAATCAATTALSVIYTPEGTFERVFYLATNPQLVLVDPEVITGAPVIYLVAGILDSLAKWFEGRAVFSGFQNPDVPTCAAMHLAELLYKRIRQTAVNAVDSVKDRIVDRSVQQVIDLVVYLTGLIQNMGQSTLRGGVAHAVHNGLTIIPESRQLLHGIKVGYGIVIQLLMEETKLEEFKEVVNFFRKLDFEPSLKGLHLCCDSDVKRKIAHKAAGDPYIGRMSFQVNSEMILSAIEKLEEIIGSL